MLVRSETTSVNLTAGVRCILLLLLYDSLNLLTVYSAAESFPWAEFPTPCALLERYLKCFFLAVFAEFVSAKDFRLCEKQ